MAPRGAAPYAGVGPRPARPPAHTPTRAATAAGRDHLASRDAAFCGPRAVPDGPHFGYVWVRVWVRALAYRPTFCTQRYTQGPVRCPELLAGAPLAG